MAYNFDNIASTYDSLNHIMSMGTDRGWRRRATRNVVTPDTPQHFLDVAVGTGDFAHDILEVAHPDSRLVGVDLSDEMMKIARGKLDNRASLLQANAECLPFPDNHFDCVSVAFGIRNFVNRHTALCEMLRVLKPGGKMVILELSSPDNALLFALYKFYLTKIIPLVGGIISGRRDAYHYLASSILRFPKPVVFKPEILNAGFRDVAVSSLTFGACRMYIAEK